MKQTHSFNAGIGVTQFSGLEQGTINLPYGDLGYGNNFWNAKIRVNTNYWRGETAFIPSVAIFRKNSLKLSLLGKVAFTFVDEIDEGNLYGGGLEFAYVTGKSTFNIEAAASRLMAPSKNKTYVTLAAGTRFW